MFRLKGNKVELVDKRKKKEEANFGSNILYSHFLPLNQNESLEIKD